LLCRGLQLAAWSGHDGQQVTKLCRVYNENPNAGDRTYKLLGLLLDEHLSFDDHCRHIHSKIAQSNFIINRSKNFLPSSALKTLYFSLIHPHLLYCLPLYGCTSQKNIKKLELIQKKSVRTISKATRLAHTAPLFQKHNIMPLKFLISYTQNLLTHSIIHKYCPPSCTNQWLTNNERNPDLELRNASDLYIPRAVNDHVKKLPYFALAYNWNSLPYDRLHPNPTTFKIFLRKHIWDGVLNENS
jgi:hypothetical protein